MKRILFFACVLLVAAISHANNVIQLPKHFKVKKTFSGDLNDTESFHLVFSKNKKTKEQTIHSYIFDGDKTLTLPLINSKNKYSVITFHYDNDILSVLLQFEKERKNFLKRIDYDLKQSTVSESDVFSHEDIYSTIRLKDKSILVYKYEDSISINSYMNNKKPIRKTYKFKDRNDEVYKFFKDKYVSPIRTNEFVSNGATNNLRLYYHDNALTFTKDGDIKQRAVGFFNIDISDKKQYNITETLSISLKDDVLKPTLKTFNNPSKKKFKKATSYFFKGNLFQLGLSKTEGSILISDISTGKKLNQITIDSSILNKIKASKDFKGLEYFLKKAGKNKHNATITVNETKTDKLILRVDYVDANYTYNYNWWHHHMMFQQHQMMHQNMMNNIRTNLPSRFGPSQPNEVSLNYVIKNKKDRYFELLISKDGEIFNKTLPETKHKEINKKEYIDKLKKNTSLSKKSSCFLKNTFRHIGYSRTLKGLVIQTNKIK